MLLWIKLRKSSQYHIIFTMTNHKWKKKYLKINGGKCTWVLHTFYVFCLLLIIFRAQSSVMLGFLCTLIKMAWNIFIMNKTKKQNDKIGKDDFELRQSLRANPVWFFLIFYYYCLKHAFYVLFLFVWIKVFLMCMDLFIASSHN